MKHGPHGENTALVFVPTFNERENVAEVCSRLLALRLDIDVLFMDDNSPDGTGEVLDGLAENNPRVQVVHRPGKLGIGSAHLEAIRLAYERGYKTLITMDCDFTHRPEYIPSMLQATGDADVVVGSRFLQPDGLSEWSRYRKFLTRLGHFLTRIVLGMKYDATGAFRLYRLDTIPLQAFEMIRSTSYSFFFESLYLLFLNRFRINELPIELPARTYGHSKMRTSDIVGSLVRLVRIFLTTHLARGTYDMDRAVTSSPRRSGS
jgi:dolichol-phosphate mannosyltransferase